MLTAEWEAERIDRHILATQVVPFGISFLDDALVGIFPNDLLVIGARTGCGKTELAATIAQNQSRKARRVVFFALEADRMEIQRRLKYRALSHVFFTQYAGKDCNYRWPRFSEWIARGLDPDLHAWEKQIDPELALQTESLRIMYMGSKYRAAQFVRDCEALAEETDLFIVDHLHYFDLGKVESEGIKEAIHAIRNLAIHLGKPVILLAHLRKTSRDERELIPDVEDFHGHSDIVKVATNVLLLSPASGITDGNLGFYPTYFHLAKSRRAAENKPYVGVVGFNQKTNSYSERYYLAHHSYFSAPVMITEQAQIPHWFKRATPAPAPTETPPLEMVKKTKKKWRQYADV